MALLKNNDWKKKVHPLGTMVMTRPVPATTPRTDDIPNTSEGLRLNIVEAQVENTYILYTVTIVNVAEAKALGINPTTIQKAANGQLRVTNWQVTVFPMSKLYAMHKKIKVMGLMKKLFDIQGAALKRYNNKTTNLKVGDRILMIVPYQKVKVGTLGTIVEQDSFELEADIGVEFDSPFQGCWDLNGLAQPGCGAYIKRFLFIPISGLSSVLDYSDEMNIARELYELLR